VAKPNIPWQIILAFLNLLIFLAIVQVWWGKSSLPPANPAQKAESEISDLPRRDSRPQSDFEIVATKNLFSAKRHSDRGGNEPGQEIDFDKSILQGIVVVGPGRVALVTSLDPQQNTMVETIRPGEIWHGFKVLEIEADKVIFESKEGQKIMSFPEPKAKEGIVRLK
jgi:hypothetical protein